MADSSNKRLSVERIYQKKSQLEHILLRPDTYIGSVEVAQEQMWVYDQEEGLVQREISYVPGLYKIFDEILVNAADNKQRDPSMDVIKIDIDPENNVISIYNNGQGIPVVEHKDEKMYVPSMIFGHLLTSSNYNDDDQKVTGGRNGYGAKLCNIFSNRFVVETSTKQYKRHFKQVWTDNMTKTTDPKIKDATGEDYTKITFSPDLKKFKMEKLDKDIVGLMSRRAFDVAASSRGVKVFLNGKRLPIKLFKDYVDLYLKDVKDDLGNPIKPVYETVNDRWEVAVAVSDKGFQQVSFVNSIATTKGGRHVDYVADMIVKNLMEVLKKKNKSSVTLKPFQIKNHMWVFVNCLIVNPTFDSQTKENMTLQSKSFGSKCALTDKFMTAVAKCGIVEACTQFANFKAQNMLQKTLTAKKSNKIKGIPKLEDANDAGTKFSNDCTLILTEGDSAKTLAVSGLSVIGRDKYGVFPLRGKLLNVRDASTKQIMENAEINHIGKILGLQYKKQYNTLDDVKSLRYGKLMIMTDQDHDGSHIKGLLINFFHHNWPTLLRIPFLEEFITPIVKASKRDKDISFFSVPEFEEWKKNTTDWPKYKIKYYKGLGTSTSKEAKEYFSDMQRHRIKFRYGGDRDDYAIKMAFSKDCVEDRKQWLTEWMEECKRRKELGLPEMYLYEKDTHEVSFKDFVNKELVLFSNLDNERSIPSMVDGLKPGQRKVLFTVFKRNDKREVKVAQLAGSVAEHSAYHHGEVSLMSTIINLAQDFIGSNNINLLVPIGQFGTRLQGGKDAASPRYIFTQMSPVARLLFPVNDEPLLNFLRDDNQKIEPEFYMPIIPMALVNGADGIGTGWSTKIPNYNPRELAENIKRMLEGNEPLPMKPWFKNFRGTIVSVGHGRYALSGEVAVLDDNKIEITELPVRVWTQSYKESVLEPFLNGTEKQPAVITDYKEYHTDTTVRFVVSMTSDNFAKARAEGFHKFFKLQSTISLNNMVAFDSKGVLRRFDTVEEILKEFYELRLSFYAKRKAYLEGILQAEAAKLSNQARFIVEKCDGKLTVENKKKDLLIDELKKKGYDSDPVLAWKISQNKEAALEEAAEAEESGENEFGDRIVDRVASLGDKPDYDYILRMPMWSLTKEAKDELLKKRDEKRQELEILRGKAPADLWREDLDLFLKELDKFEAKQIENESTISVGKKGGGFKKEKAKKETMPSTFGERIEPVIDEEMKKKVERAVNALLNKGSKKAKALAKAEASEKDNLDVLVDGNSSLVERIGGSMKKSKSKSSNKDGLKQATLNFKKVASPKKGKKKGRDSDSDDDDDINFVELEEDISPVREKTSRRAAAAKAKYAEDSDVEESEGEEIFHDNDIGADSFKPKKVADDDDDDDFMISGTDDEFEGKKPKKSSKPAAKQPKTVANEDDDDIVISDTDEEFGGKKAKKLTKPSAKRPAPIVDIDEESPAKKSKNEAVSSDDLFDSLLGSKKDEDSPKPGSGLKPPTNGAKPGKKLLPKSNGKQKEPKQPKKTETKKAPTKKSVTDSDDESSSAKKKKAPAKKIPPKKTTVASDSEDDFSDDSSKKKKAPAKKAPPKKTAAASDSEDDFSDDSSKKKKAPAKKAPPKKTAAASDSEDDFSSKPKKGGKKKMVDSDDDLSILDDSFQPPPRATTGRGKKQISYKFDDSDSD
ncbi:DNA topoisomerase 2-like [Artemia franciscana]|uniref:DNA topoisomerase 2 n=1 Tax=Artemia franciscana TaxID=6661 RepID=A0AA88LC55_ARTSF|nr:hypothetical protein QYM36_001443 [Artemia franciscana]